MSDPIKFRDVAQRLLDNGYAPLPVKPNSKATHIRGWPDFCARPPDGATLDSWISAFGNHGAAIACGNVVAVDIDMLDAEVAAATKALVIRHLGPTIERIGRAPKTLLAFRVDGERIRKRKVGQVDILGAGAYFVAFGVHPDTGRPYHWPAGSPLGTRLADLPGVRLAQIDALCDALNAAQTSPPANVAKRATLLPPANTSVVDPGSRLVSDGRDTLLRDLVYAVWREGRDDADEIAHEAWEHFQHRADLQRPKRDGARAWSVDDAREKARMLIKKSPARPPQRAPDDAKLVERLANLYCRHCTAQRLSRAAVRAALAMLYRSGARGECFEAADTLAARAKLSERAFDRARRELVELGFWLRANAEGGRRRTASYRPNLEVLNWPDPFR